MNDLDEFFARCEDVLDHWTPSDDAMVYEIGDGDEPEPKLADSYYDQTDDVWSSLHVNCACEMPPHFGPAIWGQIWDDVMRWSDSILFGEGSAQPRGFLTMSSLRTPVERDIWQPMYYGLLSEPPGRLIPEPVEDEPMFGHSYYLEGCAPTVSEFSVANGCVPFRQAPTTGPALRRLDGRRGRA